MALELTVIDSFTDQRFRGNPAAVAFVDAFPDDVTMQAIAAEMNLAETAFAARRGDGSWDLRWFTPTIEVDLCGHATLATAFLVGEPATFHTRSGALICDRGDDGWVSMDFPADPPVAVDRLDELPHPATWMGKGRNFILAELASAAEVRSYVPDFAGIAELGDPLLITAAGDRDGIDCVSRMFAPTYGIPEDPVTGSAHCLLAPYWEPRVGRPTIVGEQASRRGGTVKMTVCGDRVILAGQAVMVSRVTFV